MAMKRNERRSQNAKDEKASIDITEILFVY